MSETVNNVRISLRKDDLSNWIAVDPVLNNGEIAIATDADGNEFLKVGNGLSSFSQLDFLNQNIVKSETVQANSVKAKTVSQGYRVESSGTSMATGVFTEAAGSFQVAHGIEARALSGDSYAFVWNGEAKGSVADRYESHGEGTFSLNPVGGISGLYIGEKTLAGEFEGQTSGLVRLSSETTQDMSTNLDVDGSVSADAFDAFEKKSFTAAGTPLYDIISYDLNSTGLSTSYQKTETYTKDQVISCLDGLLSSIQETYYSKAEVSSIISGYEFGYALNFIPYTTGTICLKNSVNNVVSPAADVSVSFPRTIINSNQLGREFYLQVIQPSTAVSVSFVGYEGEQLSIMMQDGDEPLEMVPNARYQYYFCEMLPSMFMMKMAKTVPYEQPEEEYVSSYYLVNGQQNYLQLQEDCNLVFPAMTYDESGNMRPRDFTLYLKQSDLCAYQFSFNGRDGETVSFEVGNADSIASVDVSCQYFMGFSEIARDGLSSTFIAFGKKLKQVQ